MTTIKTGSILGKALQKLQSKETKPPPPASGTQPNATTSAMQSRNRDAFETRRREPVDLTGGMGTALTGILRKAGDALKGTEGTRTVVNPELQQFLTENPDIQTVQDFVEYCYAQGGDRFMQNQCSELGLSYNELIRTRSANMSDYVYSGPELAENLPHSAEEANANFITQFGDPTYNPDGATSTTNCGPTSLAMALRTAGQMPEGLTPEQQIDYARALMYPDSDSITHIEVDGQQIPQLDQDHTFTDISAITRGAQGVELGGLQGTGWASIDNALAAGNPVVCPGNVSTDWKNQFPDPSAYHFEGSGHFISVLGRTEDGQYLVADPLYPNGVVEMSREQLATFFQGSTSTEPKYAAIG